MAAAVMIVGAAALLLAGLLRLGAHARSPRPGAGQLGAAAVASGLALLLNIPWVYRWGDRSLFHEPNLSALASYLLTVAAAGAAVDMVAGLMGRQRAVTQWLRWVAVSAVASGMVATFVAGAPVQENPAFFEGYRDDPDLSAFWVLFCGSVIAATCYVAVVMRRVTHDDGGEVARGLRLIGVGACCVAVFLLDCLLQVAAPTLPLPSGEAVLVAGGLLLAVGMLWPQLATWRTRSSARRRLRPLWAAVTARYPYVRSSARKPDLYRTVIEIHDALAEARAHREVDTPLLQALDELASHPAERFNATVTDLVEVAKTARIRDVTTAPVTAREEGMRR